MMTGFSEPEAWAGPNLGFAGFLELIGNDPEFLAEFISVFDQDTRRLVAATSDASAGLDAMALERSAHALKGLLSYFGESTALELCRRLESLGARGNLEGTKALAGALDAEVAVVRKALARLVP